MLFSRAHFLLSVVAGLLIVRGADAATLSWGPGGTGGGGFWDTTAANWWDGSAAVPWSAGGTAVFGGTAGTVVTPFPGPSVAAIVFNTPGYLITNDGWLSIPSTLTVTANADATLNATLSGSGSVSTLDKEGSGVLTLGGTNFLRTLQVGAGEVRAVDSSSLVFSSVSLANAVGVTLTLAVSGSSLVDVSGLSGGGTSGGVVRPDTQSRTVTLLCDGSGTFGGVLSDNGAGKLAFTYSYPGTETLTNANTYSGATQVSGGVLLLSDQGTTANTAALTVSGSGTLRLDNSTTPLSNRLPTGAPVTLQTGTVELLGNASSAVQESLGTLTFSGNSRLNATQPGVASTLLSFTGVTRLAQGVLNIITPGTVRLSGLTPTAAGILPVFFTSGNEWAVLDAQSLVQPYTAYADLAAAGLNDNVKITGPGTVTLAGSGTRYSLNLQNTSASHAVLDLGGNTLTLAGGGLLTSGTGAGEINHGTLVGGVAELLIQSRGDLQIQASLTDGSVPVSLLKYGSGKLTLLSPNSFSGNITLSQGVLAAGSDQSLGTGTTVTFNGGSLQATAGFATAKKVSGSVLIDTNGFGVSLSGGLSGSLTKSGSGTLSVLTPFTGSASVSAGTLNLLNATSGSVTLGAAAILQAKGRLSTLNLSSTGRLDLGGSGAATLFTDALVAPTFGQSKLTVDFDLGAQASDFWYFASSTSSGSSLSGSNGTVSYLFDFHDLGGTRAGVEYPLISLPAGGSSNPVLSALSFSPEAVAAGYKGSFRVASDGVFVTLTSVPEPGSGAQLFLGGLLLGSRRARLRAPRGRIQGSLPMR